VPIDPEARDVSGWAGYRVSRTGIVWSSKARGLNSGEWIRLAVHRSRGYPIVNLNKPDRHKTAKVHLLVLEAFIGPCPEGKEGCHNDGNRENCHLDNLRWDTHQANCDDMRIHGTVARGSDLKHSSLTDQQVIEIRLKYSSGETLRSLAFEFNVNHTTIWNVVNNKTWKHV
jgi:hypothetical protein